MLTSDMPGQVQVILMLVRLGLGFVDIGQVRFRHQLTSVRSGLGCSLCQIRLGQVWLGLAVVYVSYARLGCGCQWLGQVQAVCCCCFCSGCQLGQVWAAVRLGLGCGLCQVRFRLGLGCGLCQARFRLRLGCGLCQARFKQQSMLGQVQAVVYVRLGLGWGLRQARFRLCLGCSLCQVRFRPCLGCSLGQVKFRLCLGCCLH